MNWNKMRAFYLQRVTCVVCKRIGHVKQNVPKVKHYNVDIPFTILNLRFCCCINKTIITKKPLIIVPNVTRIVSTIHCANMFHYGKQTILACAFGIACLLTSGCVFVHVQFQWELYKHVQFATLLSRVIAMFKTL